MLRRHSPILPRVWLMTDERLGTQLLATISALPPGSGIVFRHYALGKQARKALFEAVRKIARKRRLLLLVAGPTLARADGVHGRSPHQRAGVRTAPVHSVQERIAAERSGADLLFVSPVFATRSHPESQPLGRVRFGLLIRGARVPVIALGGMTRKRARSLKLLGIYGWAAIDGLSVRT
jgi:thiamine-phosphate pyrophosphorylase